MKENSEHWLSNSLILNIKYWFLGSFISFNAGWAVLIVVCILINFFPNMINNNYIVIVFICFGPLIGVFIIKCIKKDMPWYFYTVTGLIYGITYCCFLPYQEDNEFAKSFFACNEPEIRKAFIKDNGYEFTKEEAEEAQQGIDISGGSCCGQTCEGDHKQGCFKVKKMRTT